MAPTERRVSGGRWLGLTVLLLVLFGLAAAGGYLLQRNMFRGDRAKDAAAAKSPADQGPGRPAASESARPETLPPAVDPNAADPTTPEVPMTAGTSEPLAASRVTPSEPTASGGGSNGSSPGGNRKSQPAVTAGPAASAGAMPSQSATTPKVQARTGQRVEAAARPRQPLQVDQTNPLTANVAQQPPPEPAEQKAQPQSSRPSETTIAAATETGDTPPGQPARRNPGVLKPDGQPQPSISPSQQPPPVAGEGGLQPRTPDPAFQAREEGIIYWTGRLTKNQVIVIERDKATIGMAEGLLPATPVDVWLPSPAVVLVERPNIKNNWSRVAFRCLQSTNRSVTLNIQWKRLR